MSYSAEIEVQMQCYYQSLSEKDRRRYAGIEAVKLGHGGIAYISRVLGCDQISYAPGGTWERVRGGKHNYPMQAVANLLSVFMIYHEYLQKLNYDGLSFYYVSLLHDVSGDELVQTT